MKDSWYYCPQGRSPEWIKGDSNTSFHQVYTSPRDSADSKLLIDNEATKNYKAQNREE